MPDPVIFGLSLAALQLTKQVGGENCTLAGLLGEVAGGRGDQSLGNLLDILKGRLAQASPDQNHDLKKALYQAYWIAALQVANEYGTRISAPLTKAELIAQGRNTEDSILNRWAEKASAAWAHIHPPDGPAGFLLQPQQEQIRSLYKFLLQHANAADDDVLTAAGNLVEDAYRRVQHLLASDPEAHRRITDLAVQQVATIVDTQLLASNAGDEIRNNLRELLRDRWPLYFTAAFQAQIKSNEAVKSIVYARLLADLHIRHADGSLVPVSPAQLEQSLVGLESRIDAQFAQAATTQAQVLENTQKILQRLGNTLNLATRQAGILPNLSVRIFGRKAETKALREAAARSDGPKVIALVAPPGFGKTGLLTAALQQVRTAAGDWQPEAARAVLGWDFRDPSRRTLRAILQGVAELVDDAQRQALDSLAVQDLPLAVKVARVFQLLNAAAGTNGRIWLLWQNAENLLDEQRAFRDPELGAFVRMLWEHEHRCCLILESRLLPELPPCRLRLQAFVEAKGLAQGLPDGDALEWLQAERAQTESPGLAQASDADLRALVKRVHGVPLAVSSVVSYLNGPGSEIALATFLKDQALFAGFDQADETLRQESFRPIVRRHFERLAQDEQRLLGLLASFPFPLRKEAIAVRFRDARRLETALSSQRRSRMVLAESQVVAHGLPVTVYGMMSALQEVIEGIAPAGIAPMAADSQEPAAWLARGNESWRRSDFRLAFHLFEVAEASLDRFVQVGRTELENDLAGARMNKGTALSALGNAQAAIVEYDAAILIRERLVQAGRTELENDLAAARMNKGNALRDLGNAQAAIVEYDAAIILLQRLVQAGRAELENDLAAARMNKGNALSDLGNAQAAIVEYDAAIILLQRLVQAGRTELENDLARARMNKGVALSDLGNAQAAIVEYDAAIIILQRLVQAGRAELENDLAGARMNKGNALSALGNAQAAIVEYDAAIIILQRLVQAGRAELENDLAGTRMNKGNALSALGNAQAAIVEYDAAIIILQRLVQAGRAELENDLAAARMNKGTALRALGNAQAAIVEYDAAIIILQRLVQAGRAELRPDLARVLANRVTALAKSGQRDRATTDLRQALEYLEAAKQDGFQGLDALTKTIQNLATQLGLSG